MGGVVAGGRVGGRVEPRAQQHPARAPGAQLQRRRGLRAPLETPQCIVKNSPCIFVPPGTSPRSWAPNSPRPLPPPAGGSLPPQWPRTPQRASLLHCSTAGNTTQPSSKMRPCPRPGRGARNSSGAALSGAARPSRRPACFSMFLPGLNPFPTRAVGRNLAGPTRLYRTVRTVRSRAHEYFITPPPW